MLSEKLHGRVRRSLPSGRGGPSAYPPLTAATVSADGAWLQPMPDAMVGPPSDDPQAIAESHANLRLALIAALLFPR